MTNLKNAQIVSINNIGEVALTFDNKLFVVRDVEVDNKFTYHPVTLDRRIEMVYEKQIVREVALDEIRELICNKGCMTVQGYFVYVKSWASANHVLDDIEILRLDGHHELADKLERNRKPAVKTEADIFDDVMDLHFDGKHEEAVALQEQHCPFNLDDYDF